MRKSLAAVSLTALAAAVLQANAADQIEEVTVIGQPSEFGATKSDTPIMENPRSISVITAEDFIARGALALSNTLEYTAGVTSTAFGFATRGDFVSIRGLDAPQYLDNLQVQFGFYNNARTEIYTLEQIEVLKGPASVLYGQAAPGGIVSAVSKVAGEGNTDKEIVLEAGSFSRLQAGVDLGFDISGDGSVTGRIVGLVRHSDTQVNFVNDDSLVFAPSITWQNDSTKITGLINYTDRESDTSAQFLPLVITGCASSDVTFVGANVCAAASGRQVDNDLYVGDPNFNRYDTESTTVSLLATHEFNDVFSFAGTMRHRDNEADYKQSWISFTGPGTRVQPNGVATRRTWYDAPASTEQFGLDFRFRAEFETGALEHDVLLGVNYQDVDTSINSAYGFGLPTAFNVFNPVYDGSEIPPAAALDAIRSLTETNTKATDFYLINQMELGNLIVNAGVRFSSVDSKDATNDQKDEETPVSFGAMYRTDIGLNPYVSYAESFRATVGSDVVKGGALKPRFGEQVEVGFKYQPEGKQSYLIVSWFDLEEDNLVDFVVGGRTQRGLTFESTGFEVEALIALGDFSFDIDYRNLDANEVAANGAETQASSIPEDTVSIWAEWTPEDGSLVGFKAGLGVRYEGEVVDVNPALTIKTDGYALVDAMIGYEGEDFDLSLNIRNLANKDYYATCLTRGDCFPGEERSAVVTLTKQF